MNLYESIVKEATLKESEKKELQELKKDVDFLEEKLKDPKTHSDEQSEIRNDISDDKRRISELASKQTLTESNNDIVVAMECNRVGYGPDQVMNDSMTVGELIRCLEGFDSDMKIVTSHDDGYTYGPIYSSDFREENAYDDDDDEEIEEAEESKPKDEYSDWIKKKLASEDLDEIIWAAVCSGDLGFIRNAYETKQIKPNERRYERFGGKTSYIMGALRNNEYDMVDLLKDFGETIMKDELPEYRKLMGARYYDDELTKGNFID